MTSKKFGLLLLLFLAGTLTAIETALAVRGPRKITVGTRPTLQMVNQGRVNFEIVAGPTPAAQFAATEAASVLGRAFGAKLSVLTRPTGKLPALLIGTEQPQKLDRDGFVIRTEGSNVVIAGNDDPRQDPISNFKNYGRMGERGTIHGVYAFLERFAGARFYFPGELGTIVPRRSEWALPNIDIVDRPDYRERKVSDGMNGKNMALTYLLNRFASETIPNCHGLAFLGFIERFGKTHPEYFALQENGKRHMDINAARPSSRSGHICISSKIKDEIADDAIAFLSGKPASSRGVVLDGKSYWSFSRFPAGMPYFNIMPNDSFYRCRCPECWKYFSQGPQETSNHVWRFFADIGRKVKASGVPGKLTTMAYDEYKLLPDVDIPDNILVMLALRGPWDENNSAIRERDEALLRSWTQKLGTKIWLWTYPSKWSIEVPAIPNVAPRAVGSFYKRLAPYIFGAYLEAETDRELYNYLNFYIFGKVAWDNSADVAKLLDEHHKLMFGAGAPMLKDFYESLEHQWMRIAGKAVETPAGPVTVVPSNEEIWEKIYSEKELARLDKLLSSGRAVAAADQDSDSVKRIDFVRRNFFSPLANERKNWLAARSGRDRWQTALPAEVSLLPVGNKPAEVATQVKIEGDFKSYIFTFNCEEPHTAHMNSTKRAADDPELWRDSTVEIMLNPSGDRKHYFQIIVNPLGCITDLIHAPGTHNLAWNSGAEAETKIVPGKGWTARVTVPRKALGKIAPGGFPANLCRYRSLSGVKITTTTYNWSPSAKTFHDIGEWGRIDVASDKRPQIIRNGDFNGNPNHRFLGSGDAMWFSSQAFPLDRTVFVTGSGSIKLVDNMTVAQYLKALKPDTRYVLSFYVRLDKVVPAQPGRGFNVRFDEGNGHVTMFPRAPMTDSVPWTRMECIIKTHAAVGSPAPAYVRFQFPKGTGAAWVDQVRLHEIAE